MQRPRALRGASSAALPLPRSAVQGQQPHQRWQLTPQTTAAPAPCRAGAEFPLFDLPAEAVELVLGCVESMEDKRALRLVCKRTRASVDSRVVAVKDGIHGEPLSKLQLNALVQAPWQLRLLDLSHRKLGDAGAAALAAARWPALQRRWLDNNSLGPAGAASLAAAHLPALQVLGLQENSLGNAGAASLAAARWPALQSLRLGYNSLGPAGAASLAAARLPALRVLSLQRNSLRDAGAASLAAAVWPAGGVSVI